MYVESSVKGILHFIGSEGLENDGEGFKKRRAMPPWRQIGLRDRMCLAVYEMRVRSSRRGLRSPYMKNVGENHRRSSQLVST
jgi:hypothetical protein